MKKLIYIMLCFMSIIAHSSNGAPFAIVSKELSIEEHLEELQDEIEKVTSNFKSKHLRLSIELAIANRGIKESLEIKKKLHWLLIKDALRDESKRLYESEQSEISKIRYIKGLQIIKILYEKTLALDHHFASISTFNEINNIANPNTYPEFQNIKENLGNKSDKKSGFDLTKILGNNIYTSVAHSFISLFSNDNSSKEEKEKSLEEVECILDFTLRMHNDLNTIYFETVFLQKSNANIMDELQQLFVDYTKPIKYNTPLPECRNSDDWSSVRNNLNQYLEQLEAATLDETQSYKAHKMQINLEFPIDRLLQFITIYNAFIDQGGKFYEKFGIMLNSYENEQQCATKLPLEYKKLKENVDIAIDKFNTAYKPVEINGSKMKQVLYGLNEYD